VDWPTLLAPSSAALAAAVAFPALLALYLLKLRRRPVRVSATVLWEQAAHDLQVNTPLRWLRMSLLLLLHLLIVGLFVLALGRPAIDAGGLGTPQRAVIVIDRSASMSARDGGTPDAPATRLERAKDEAKRLLDAMSRGVGGASVALVTFAAEPKVVVGMTPDLRLVRDEIDAITPTDQPGDLFPALELVTSLVNPEGAEPSAENPVVVTILGDGSYARERPFSAGSAEIRYVRCGPDAAAGKSNLGVSALSARRDDGQPSLLRVFARLTNASAAETPAALALAISGEVVQRRAVTVPGGTPTSNQSEPGAVGVTFEVVMPQAGIVTVSLPGGDPLAADDQASILVAPALRPSVLFVTPGGTPNAAGITAEGLLADILAELPLQRLRTVNQGEFDRLLADGSVSTFDLIIADRTDLAALPPVPTLALGSSLPTAGLALGPQRGDGAAWGYAITWERGHPTLRDVSMDTVFVNAARPFVEPPAEAAAAVKLESLARGLDGAMIRVSEDAGVRRLATNFEVAQSNWALQPGFAIFLSSAVEFLTGRNAESASTAYTTSSRIEWSLAGERPASGEVEIAGPVVVRATLPPGSPRVVVGPFERAGVYSAGALAPPVAAVNLTDERESSLATADTLDVAGRSVAASAGAGGPTEIWPYLVMLAGALLVVEWLVYAIRSRAT
jgi:hypothetical protein